MITQCKHREELAMWCCLYKGQVDRKKVEVRHLKEELEILKSLLSELNAELTFCRDRLSLQDQRIEIMKKISDEFQVAIIEDLCESYDR